MNRGWGGGRRGDRLGPDEVRDVRNNSNGDDDGDDDVFIVCLCLIVLLISNLFIE